MCPRWSVTDVTAPSGKRAFEPFVQVKLEKALMSGQGHAVEVTWAGRRVRIRRTNFSEEVAGLASVVVHREH
jgi:hypothetical protein